MALNYTTVPIRDLGAGIDQQSSENQIKEGFSEDLLNCDPKPEGYLVKRRGYEGFGGNVPLRVESVDNVSATELCFTFASDVNLSQITKSPILVYGKTSNAAYEGNGPLSTSNSLNYFSTFSLVSARVEAVAGPQTLNTTGTTNYTWTHIAESTSFVNDSNEMAIADSVVLTKADNSIDIGITVNNIQPPATTQNIFIYTQDKSDETGITWNGADGVQFGTKSCPTGDTTITATAAQHGIDDFSFIIKAFIDTGTTYEEIIPKDVEITPAGNVTVTIENSGTIAFDAFISISATPIANTQSFTINPTDSGSTTITGISTDFPVVAVYEEDLGTGNLNQVYPTSIVVDAVTREMTISVVNNSNQEANFVVYYEFASVQVNKICVITTDLPTGPTQEDLAPQLSIWGIPQTEAYLNSTSSRPGWVTHIDSYRSLGEAYVVAGLGGVMHRYSPISTFGSAYGMPVLYPRLSARLASSARIGPVFWNTFDTPGRTRGYLQCNNASNNEAQVQSISYNGTNTEYVLYCEGGFVERDSDDNLAPGTLSTIISTTDYLTIRSAGLERYNGTFQIVSAALSTTTNTDDTLTITVVNPAVDNADFNETDSGAKAAIYTDDVTLASDSEFLDGDIIKSDLLDATSNYAVSSSSGTSLKLSGVRELIILPAGLRLVGQRTSNILPVRTLGGAPAVGEATNGYFVRYDMVSYSPVDRLQKVLHVNALDDIDVSITGDGTTATATLTGAQTTTLEVGQKVLFIRAGNFQGEYEIASISGLTTFTFASTVVGTGVAGVMKGKTLEIDEPNGLTWEDTVNSSNTVFVPARFLPIEAPEDLFSLTKDTYTRYFTSSASSEQSFLRSVMMRDNMYFTNGDDTVMKYDGSSLYRAGLFRWQPHLFVTTDTNPTGAISGEITITGNQTQDLEGIEAARFKVKPGDESKFFPGDIVRLTTAGVAGDEYTVTGTQYDTGGGNHGHVDVKEDLFALIDATPAADTYLQLRQQFRYYFKLNVIDANNNIIASAVTGADDFIVNLYESAQVRIRLTGFPVMDNYEYSRIEVEVYRSKANAPGTYFRRATLEVPFDTDQPYLDFIDTGSDSILLDNDQDNTNAGVLVNFGVDPSVAAAELSTGLSEPLRAKYITTAGNRLILGNLRDYPEMDVRVVDVGNRITQTVFNGQQWEIKIDNTNDVAYSTVDLNSRIRFEMTTSASTITGVTPTENVGFTVTATNSLSPGDWVYIFHSTVADGQSLEACGWWQVVTANGSSFTVTATNMPATLQGSFPDRFATTANSIPVYIGTDGNYGMSNGNRDAALAYEFVAMRRLANAINCAMRQATTPWITASAGNEFATGQLVLRTPKVLTTTPELVLPTYDDDVNTGFTIFVNNIARASASQAQARTRRFPSRVIASAANYPEIFDKPGSLSDQFQDTYSAVDVNSADGQEITGMIPFFGDAAFGSAQQGAVIVVFKENSIYLVDFEAKSAGGTVVQRIESQGLGCTAPYSIAATRDAIIFANESGIFRLTKSLKIEYVGQKVERLWQDGLVNRGGLDIAQGTHYALGRQYKLSIPTGTSTVNSDVMVYNHTREYRQQGFGSWTRYDNHPATGWANLETEAYFGSTGGEVFRLRNSGSEFDFRDDSGNYTMSATLRAMDFGDAALRKAVSRVVVQFRTTADQDGTSLLSAPDLRKDFTNMDAFKIDLPEADTGLLDEEGFKIRSLSFSPNRRKLNYYQLKFTNSALDEALEVAGIDIRVGGLAERGLTEAQQTNSENS